MHIPSSPFKVEKLRDKLARQKRIEEFKFTYSSKFPEIKDLNTSILWDELNDRPFMDSSISPMTTHKLKIIASSLRVNGCKILNVGCGGGDLENVVFKLPNLKKINWCGVDISPLSIKRCKKEFKNGRFSLGQIDSLKFKDNEFDTVILMEILEHIRPKKLFKSLREIKRVLKPGGELVVSVPTNEGLPDLLKKGLNPNAHVRAYTKDVLTAELTLSGFEVKKVVELFAFRSLYYLKSLVAKYFWRRNKHPNNLVVFAKKI